MLFYKRRQKNAQSAVCTVYLTVQNQLQKSPAYSWLITLVFNTTLASENKCSIEKVLTVDG